MDRRLLLAFTMTEILITISIIAIVTTVPVMAYSQISRNARDTKRKEHIDSVAAAIQSYKITNGSYPEVAGYDTLGVLLIPEYLSSLPKDPGGLPYIYTSDSGGRSFSLSATLDKKSGGNNEIYVAVPGGKQIITGAPPGAPTAFPSPTGISPLQLTLTPLAATRTPTPVPSNSPTPVPSIVIAPVTIPLQGRHIVRGADNNMWVTAWTSGSGPGISRITNAGAVSSWTLSAPNTDPGQIFTGPDLNMWFAGSSTQLSAISTTGSLVPLGFATASYLRGGMLGSDGNIWLAIGSPAGNVRVYNTQGQVQASYPVTGGDPRGIVRGSDNVVWIYTVSPSQTGRFQDPDFVYSALPPSGTPVDIASGVNANVWVGMSNGVIVKANAAGTASYPTGLTALNSVARGNDRNTWYAGSDAGGCKIGRITETGEAYNWELPECTADLVAGIGRTVWAVSGSSATVYKVTY